MASRSRALLIVGVTLAIAIVVGSVALLASQPTAAMRPAITTSPEAAPDPYRSRRSTEAADREEARRAIQAIRERERRLDARDAAAEKR